MRRTLLTLALAAAAPSVALTLTPAAAEAKGRKPEDALRGRIILSTSPFPASFKDDATFISTMKRVDTKAFRFGEAEKIAVEIMAFFAKPVDRTELTATLYDTTERVLRRAIAEGVTPLRAAEAEAEDRIRAAAI